MLKHYAAKNIDILAINLNVLHNYFDNLLKLFSDLCLIKFFNTSIVLSVIHLCFYTLELCSSSCTWNAVFMLKKYHMQYHIIKLILK